MSYTLRTPNAADLPALSALCLRSKAYWGYPQDFLDACRAELTLTPGDLMRFSMQMAVEGGVPLAVAAVDPSDPAELELMFVDPPHIGRGLGRRMFYWACAAARAQGARALRIEADPGAVPFYERFGARVTGTAPSASVPGRRLPVLIHTLPQL